MVKKNLIKFVLSALLLAIIPAGCSETREMPAGPHTFDLSTAPVPDIPLDIYVFIKQARPTALEGNVLDTPGSIEIVSAAVWVTSVGDESAAGAGVTLTSNQEASQLYSAIGADTGWKKLDGNMVYIVNGPTAPADLLKKAINDHAFKEFDDKEALEALSLLPSGSRIRPAGMAVIKPSAALLKSLSPETEDNVGIDIALSAANLKIIAAGLYAPDQIEVKTILDIMQDLNKLESLDLGALVVIKSGLPGIVLKPTLTQLLSRADFSKTAPGELEVYKGQADIDRGTILPILVRFEGSNVFVSISGRESYGRALIESIK